MAEFNGKEDVNIVEKKTCDTVSAKRKHLLGVTKKGNKWRAKTQNPKLKVQVRLGYFSTPEEAALVKRKKAEFKEMLKGEEAAVFSDRKRRELYGGKPRGSRECAVDDEVLQETESEEAAVIADRKTEVYGAKVTGSSECEVDYKVLQETESEEAAVVKNKKAEFEDTLKGTDGLRIESRRRHEFEGRKLPSGVCRRGCGKFRVRIWHPGLKKYASFGNYSTCKEAAIVADRKRAELQEVYGGKPKGSSECKDDDEAAVVADRTRKVYGAKVRGSGECEVDDKDLQETETEEASVVADRKHDVYEAKVRGSSECEDDDNVLQETESEEAAVVAVKKRREVYGGKVGGSGEVLQEIEIDVAGKFGYVNEQSCDVKVLAGVSSKRVAVDPVSNSEEKAVLDTKMNRTEFEEKFFGKENVNIVQSEACDGVLAKRKQFFGVNKKGKKWQARIRHPKTKFKLHLGYFSTPEEAALVVKNKKAEFKEMLKVEEDLKEKRRMHELLELYGREEVACKFECLDAHTSDIKVPASARRVRSGRSVARVKDPGSRASTWLGTKGQMGSDGLNNFEMSDKLNCGVVDVPDKLECEFVQGSPTSNIEPGMSGDKIVIEKESQRKTTCSLDFDEAVTAGFINEYGQLVGKYRVLDEQLYLGLPDEIVAVSGQEILLI